MNASNDRTVFLELDCWLRIWKEMCSDLGYVPSWDEMPTYFGCVFCEPISSGFRAVFKTKEEALLFKLRCR